MAEPAAGEGRRGLPTSSRLLLIGAMLLVPLLGFALLMRQPSLDLRWEHHPTHFWLVLTTAALSAVLAYATGAAAEQRGDARVLWVSLAFLSAAGFLGLHALATPGVLLMTANTGFVVATPVGIALGSVLAVVSSLDLSGARAVRMVRRGRQVRLALLALMVLWAVFSLARLPPLQADQIVPEQADGVLGALAVPAIVLYAVAAGRYVRLWRRRPSLMLLSMLAAFVLLAEAMVAVVFARNWQLSWWEWHVLLLAAFVLVALGARLQWHEERFADLYLQDTSAGRREMSILFADLQGFTTFSERHEPAQVTAMLNAFFEVAVPPVVHRFGGEIDRIIGDALMVTFNKRGDQPDHAVRAARAGLALQEATAAVVAQHPDWPRFRVGINSGEVLVSLLGTEGGRTHTVIGDVVNSASRIEGKAPVGGVAIGPGTKALLPTAVTESLGKLELKGKAEPLEVHLLRRLDAAVG
ncbi:adenylate/guanylate cyclase domain-containing protein [Nocardioides mesophilus]|uniref:Adenylate/guanylate cyclase domain-containing protein n=1 Tax=Nocardioides mesophilus TaxID=433659 RepID=A0A7G9R9W1_9ACTN|nr:adenylate/guanylate cyclase domain-containing protein [Nocardioides mesophilus]QNN52386.1 adenylate/guanylate cyclase domain-containing protein [Nocardioides mesophilus]